MPGQDSEFDEHDPRWQVKLLAQRVDALCKEKEDLERENTSLWLKFNELDKKVDRALNRGAGMLFIMPFFGIVVGWFLAYGSRFFRGGQ